MRARGRFKRQGHVLGGDGTGRGRPGRLGTRQTGANGPGSRWEEPLPLLRKTGTLENRRLRPKRWASGTTTGRSQSCDSEKRAELRGVRTDRLQAPPTSQASFSTREGAGTRSSRAVSAWTT